MFFDIEWIKSSNLCYTNLFLGVPACCAAQSACCGLRYCFGAVRTMLTHALRMPNAKEVFFVGLMGFPPTHPRVKNEVKNTSFY